MPKPGPRSALYRLIEAGQLARQALVQPLLERGLEPGDDALIFILMRSKGETEANLAVLTGLTGDALALRASRLLQHEIVERRAVGPQLSPGLRLTGRGRRLAQVLADHWQDLEEVLFHDLLDEDRKSLRRMLRRFVKLLRV